MTALSKIIREAIEESLINATTIPAEKDAILKAAGATARDALRKTLPKGFEDTVKNLPPEWFSADSHVDIRKDVCPAWILQDEEGRKSGWGARSLRFETLRHPAGWFVNHQIGALPPEDDKKAPNWESILDKHNKAAQKLRDKEDALRVEIRAVLWSVNTAEKLIAEVPAWEKHILPHMPKKPMPLVVQPGKAEALLKKAGFDQTEKEAA